jgi:hypothetical protein
MAQRRQRGWLKKESRTQGETWVLVSQLPGITGKSGSRAIKLIALMSCRERTGLEPAASCVTGRRSNQLNYAPALKSTP